MTTKVWFTGFHRGLRNNMDKTGQKEAQAKSVPPTPHTKE